MYREKQNNEIVVLHITPNTRILWGLQDFSVHDTSLGRNTDGRKCVQLLSKTDHRTWSALKCYIGRSDQWQEQALNLRSINFIRFLRENSKACLCQIVCLHSNYGSLFLSFWCISLTQGSIKVIDWITCGMYRHLYKYCCSSYIQILKNYFQTSFQRWLFVLLAWWKHVSITLLTQISKKDSALLAD